MVLRGYFRFQSLFYGEIEISVRSFELSNIILVSSSTSVHETALSLKYYSTLSIIMPRGVAARGIR